MAETRGRCSRKRYRELIMVCTQDLARIDSRAVGFGELDAAEAGALHDKLLGEISEARHASEQALQGRQERAHSKLIRRSTKSPCQNASWPGHGSWIFYAPDLEEHVAWRRSKIALLAIGMAVVLVANVTYLGFLAPPRFSRESLWNFTHPKQHISTDQQNLNATELLQEQEAAVKHPESFIALILNKTEYNLTTGNSDLAMLSLSDYVAIYSVGDSAIFCGSSLSTPFAVINGFAFTMALSAVMIVGVLPIFTKRHCWDLRLARIGAIFMAVCLLCFLVAFLLAGFITSGKGVDLDTCAFTIQGYMHHRATADSIVTGGIYATLGLAGVLVLLVIVLAAIV
ncbi:hypothetical protein WJX73_007127 [Symbiochloris irregularis]|uniref:Uncharacterized protein n=1 Tax=Symbiochloris irregularis TaxID=706552 RepID=A0AAW1PRD3_9CHLO